MEAAFKEVIPSLVKTGVFGQVRLLDLGFDDTTEKGAQFASTLAFANLKVEGKNGEEVFKLVVKVPFSDVEMRELRHCDIMFYNEVSMYLRLLPELGIDERLIPKMYHGIGGGGVDPHKDILILDNITYKNYILPKQKIFLDFDHISLVMKKIAQFHSFSYIYKHKNRINFYQLAESLKDFDFPFSSEDEFIPIYSSAVIKGIKQFIEKNVNENILNKCINLLKCPYKAKKIISIPEEPFAVICHGDFCNNNLLYKYDETGKPSDCIIYDFQFAKYSNPAIDLSFFLYMHTTAEFRAKHWDEVLRIYWDTLRSSVPKEINIPSFADFLKHFATRAIYGYIISSFFLPMMMDDNRITMDEYMEMSWDERAARYAAHGGEEGERIVSEIVSHLINNEYIQNFIELYEQF